MMRRILIGLALIVGVLFAVSGAVARADDDPFMGGFDGRWQGEMAVIDMTPYDPGASAPSVKTRKVQIVINGASAHVFYFYDKTNSWNEVKAGEFVLAVHKTNAVLYATDSSEDVYDKTGSGGWVETWNYTLTHKDRDSLYVTFVRAVNNYLEPPDKKDDAGHREGRFFVVAFGEMRRVAP
jgi:hypothetical protein